MSVLVTGGAGYIGSHMALELLDAGERTVVLDNLSTGLARAVPKEAELIEGDVGDQGLVRSIIEGRGIEFDHAFCGLRRGAGLGCRSIGLLPQ